MILMISILIAYTKPLEKSQRLLSTARIVDFTAVYQNTVTVARNRDFFLCVCFYRFFVKRFFLFFSYLPHYLPPATPSSSLGSRPCESRQAMIVQTQFLLNVLLQSRIGWGHQRLGRVFDERRSTVFPVIFVVSPRNRPNLKMTAIRHDLNIVVVGQMRPAKVVDSVFMSRPAAANQSKKIQSQPCN